MTPCAKRDLAPRARVERTPAADDDGGWSVPLWAVTARPTPFGRFPPDGPWGSAAPGHRRRRWVRFARVVGLAAVVVLAVTAAVFWSAGGRWWVVRTPSMGTTAPVGSLVLTTPTRVRDTAVGDIVAFHPRDLPTTTFTHRVVRIENGLIVTRGDINGSDDAWGTDDAHLVGAARVVVPGLGYLVRALPLLGLGGLVLVVLTRWWVPLRWRGPARLLGVAALYLAAALTIRPFLGVVSLATDTDPTSARMVVASTGLLPVGIAPLPGHGQGAALHLSYGGHGTALLTDPPRDGRFAVGAHLDLDWQHWLMLAAVWALPLLWVLLVGFRDHERDPVDALLGGSAFDLAPAPSRLLPGTVVRP